MKYFYILLLAIPFTTKAELSILKPLTGLHYKEREHKDNLKWNNNFLKSLGIRYGINNFGVSATYAHLNSLKLPSWYLHVDYTKPVYKHLNLGVLLGVRNGYPKKAINRSKNNFIPSLGINVESCYERHCLTGFITPIVSVIGYKFILTK